MSDEFTFSTEELARWLDKKYSRHGEIEDGLAAERLRTLQARVDELKGLQPFIEEIWFAHRDKDSEEYNECDTGECCWCEETRKILANSEVVT